MTLFWCNSYKLWHNCWDTWSKELRKKCGLIITKKKSKSCNLQISRACPINHWLRLNIKQWTKLIYTLCKNEISSIKFCYAPKPNRTSANRIPIRRIQRVLLLFIRVLRFLRLLFLSLKSNSPLGIVNRSLISQSYSFRMWSVSGNPSMTESVLNAFYNSLILVSLSAWVRFVPEFYDTLFYLHTEQSILSEQYSLPIHLYRLLTCTNHCPRGAKVFVLLAMAC